MLTRSRPLLTLAVLALGLASVLGGCGKDDERAGDPRTVAGADADTTEPAAGVAPEDGPASAFAAWLGALARREEAEACSLQAPELTIALRHDAILVDRAELGDPCVDFVALLWEDPAFESEIVDITITQVTAETALLDVQLGRGTDTTDLTVRMAHHRARWRVFSIRGRTEGEEAAGPARWVAAWCDLSPDMSQAEIVALMGAPSGDYTVSDGGEPQLWWAEDQYDFRVYLDVDGSVLELVGDYDALGEDDRAQLTCPELRS